jgi:hypothetical protein
MGKSSVQGKLQIKKRLKNGYNCGNIFGGVI